MKILNSSDQRQNNSKSMSSNNIESQKQKKGNCPGC